MKRRNLWILICALGAVLAALITWAVQLRTNQPPEVMQTQPTQTQTQQTTVPATAPTTVPTDPGPNWDAVIAELNSQAEDADEEFLRWIMDCFGTQVLLDLQTAFSDGYDRSDWYTAAANTYAVLQDVYSGAADTQSNIHLLSLGTPGRQNDTTALIFGGDICLADNYLVMEHLAATGGSISDAIDPALIAEMQAADVTFLNNEFAISDGGTPMAGKAYTFRAKTTNTALYQELGVNLVSLANNHAYDYGESAFLDTLDALKAHGIAQIGGGRDLEEAMTPQYYIVNGRKIAFVAATRAEKNIMTPAATADTPGVLRCYDTALFLQVIRKADENSDFVVACIHWGTEYAYALEEAQTSTAREYIDAGVDLIIGAHAHQLQGIEFYNGKAIFYNLGNFWFNSYDIETGLVKAELNHDGDVTYTFLPALQSGCVTTSQIGTARGQQVLDTLRKYSVNVSIDENGIVTEAE